MHIGLIGGIGPAATDYYYRGLINNFEGKSMDLELTIAHADTKTLLKHLASNDTTAQAEIFERLTERLKAAGAMSVAITSIAGHFCIEDFKAKSSLPVVDLLTSVSSNLQAEGYGTVGIIGTKTVMKSKMYGCLPTQLVLLPSENLFEPVHQSYVDMAKSGVVTDMQRQIFFECGREMCDQRGAEAVVLGGTDLFLAFEGQESGFNTIDCALWHMEDLAEEAAR